MKIYQPKNCNVVTNKNADQKLILKFARKAEKAVLTVPIMSNDLITLNTL